MQKVIKYVIIDILRNRVMIAYTLLLLIISFTVFNLQDNSAKGILTMLNLVQIIVPLVSIVFATIYIYNSSEFIELLLAQPLKRNTLLFSIFCGLSLALMLSFFIGAGIPILVFDGSITGIMMVATGTGLTIIFVSLAVLASVLTRDKAKGIGIAIMIWFYCALIYDGLLLFLLFQFSEYPLEKAVIVFSSLNPVDLARILILIKLDFSALMGYTGAVLQKFFGSNWGMWYASIIMVCWMIVPVWLALRKFNRKDL